MLTSRLHVPHLGCSLDQSPHPLPPLSFTSWGEAQNVRGIPITSLTPAGGFSGRGVISSQNPVTSLMERKGGPG